MQALETERKPYAFAALAAVLLAISVVLSVVQGPDETTAPTARMLELDPVRIEGRAAIILDPQTGEVLFRKNEKEQLPLASLTKLLTAYLALETDADRRVTISKEDLAEEGDAGLIVGESWDISSLVSFALVTSSNDAIAAAARAARIDPRITLRATTVLDLPQTFALNPTGLDFSSSTAGAYGSAQDIARLFTLLLAKYPHVLSYTATNQSVFETLNGKPHLATSTGRVITDIPGLIALKTGFTDLAGGNLAVAFDRGFGQPLIAVVLGSSREGRFTDMRLLIAEARGKAL